MNDATTLVFGCVNTGPVAVAGGTTGPPLHVQAYVYPGLLMAYMVTLPPGIQRFVTFGVDIFAMGSGDVEAV